MGGARYLWPYLWPVIVTWARDACGTPRTFSGRAWDRPKASPHGTADLA